MNSSDTKLFSPTRPGGVDQCLYSRVWGGRIDDLNCACVASFTNSTNADYITVSNPITDVT